MSKENLTEVKEDKKLALTRQMLKGMDIEKENIDTIIEAHTETVDSLKATRDEYKAKVDELQTQIEHYNSQKDSMIDKSEYDSLKTKFDKLKGEFDDYKNDIAEKNKMASKTEAYKKLLKETGISEKRISSVVKVADLGKIELDEDGKIKDADKLTESIKEEWADFIETKKEKGAETDIPPANNGGNTDKTPSRAAQIAAQYHADIYGDNKEE